MGKIMTDDRHYKAIANTIREQMKEAGMNETMRPSEMPGWIHDACAVAKAKGEEICAEKHFVHNFVGDGRGTYSFHVPFEPDVVQIMGFDPRVLSVAGYLALVLCDIGAFGLLAGFVQYAAGAGAVSNTAYTTVGMRTRYSRTEDGTVTIANIGPAGVAVNYGKGISYTAVAVKYTDQTDKERIIAFVTGLTGSGSVTLNKAKVSAAFTDSQWAALIATKPRWTFSWI